MAGASRVAPAVPSNRALQGTRLAAFGKTSGGGHVHEPEDFSRPCRR